MKNYRTSRNNILKAVYVFVLLFAAGITFGQRITNDSLVNQYSSLPQSQSRVEVAIELCRRYLQTNKDSCRIFGHLAKKEAKILGLIAEETLASSYLGKLHYSKSQFDSSRFFLEQAITISESLPEYSEKRASYATTIARSYQSQDLFTPALEQFQRALELTDLALADTSSSAVKMKDLILSRKASIFNDLGVLYSDLKDYDKARGYFIQNLEGQLALNQTEDIPFSYNNIGYINLMLGCYEEAIPYVQKSLELRSPKDLCGQMYPIFNLGYIHSKRLQYDSAYHYLEIALDRSLACNSTHIELLSRINLGKLQIRENDFIHAEKNLQSAYELSINKQKKLERVDALEALTDLYKKMGRYQLAVTYLEKHHAAKDSLFNEDNIKKFAQQEVAFEYDKEKRQLEAIQERARLQFQADLSQQQYIKWIFIGILIVAICFLIVSQWYYRLKHRLVRELKDKNQKILSTQEQLIMHKKMALMGLLTAGIAHEIKNPLNFITNFAEGSTDLVIELEEELKKNETGMSVNNYPLIIDLLDELKKNSNDIYSQGQRADRIINSMMDHSRGGASEKQYVDINRLVDDNLNLAYHGLRSLDTSFSVDIQKEFAADLSPILVSPNELGRVLLNLINNAYQTLKQKHRNNKKGYQPQILIKTQHGPISNGLLPEVIEIRIRDNGSGISTENREKIFDPFFTTSKSGEGNTGLGLSISYDIIANGHQGKLYFKTEEGVYTEFIIELPLK